MQDLCHLLNAMGARIRGIGTHVLEIEGVKELSGATFRIGSDHIEAGSFIGLAAVTGSDLVIEGAPNFLSMITLNVQSAIVISTITRSDKTMVTSRVLNGLVRWLLSYYCL